jgi:hypothetical protein
MDEQTHNPSQSRRNVSKHELEFARVYPTFPGRGPVRKAPPEEDVAGVDFIDENGFIPTTIQLKVDLKSDRTNRFFIETHILQIEPGPTQRLPGWATHITADELWFMCPQKRELVCVKRRHFELAFRSWKQRYEIRGPVVNQQDGDRWEAYGMAIPCDQVARPEMRWEALNG